MSQAPSFLSEPQIVDLPLLVDDVRRGDIQVPRFQRRFVWDDERRIELLRSIRSGIPIGSLLVWRTSTRRLRCFPRIAGIVIPQPKEGRTISYLLDGHQRLTSIFGCFNASSSTSTNTTLEADDPPREVVYNVDRDDFEIDGSPGNDLRLRLSLFLDPVALRRRFRAMERASERTPEKLDELQYRAEEVLKAFERCRIPIVPLTTEDLELATKTFHRVNSQGVSMSEIDMVAALTWKDDFDLRDEIESSWAKVALPSNWRPTTEQQVLNVVKGTLNLEVAKATEERLIKGIGDDVSVVRRSVDGLGFAMKFITDQLHLDGPEIVPYQMQLTLTAAALANSGQTIVRDEEQVRRWWGLTTVWGIFAGGASHRVQAAFKHLIDAVKGKREPWPEVLFRSLEPLDLPPLDFRNARAKYFVAGYARSCNLQGLLRVRGSRALVSLFRKAPNTPGNRFLWNSEKLMELQAALAEGNLDALHAHFVDGKCIDLYRQEDHDAFIRHRTSLMNQVERDWFAGLQVADFIDGK